MYSESGAYAITASFWNADCGLITITTEFYVEGCGDVMPEGCYDEEGVFYYVGSEIWITECEFMFCDTNGEWSDIIEISGCQQDCFILYDWFLNPNGLVIAEAYDYPYDAELVWTVNGDTIAVDAEAITFDTNNILEPFELCVSFGPYEGDENDNEEENYECDGAEYCEVIAPIIEGMGCFDADGQFYPIGFELWMSECEYFECMPPGYWSRPSRNRRLWK